MTELGSDSYRPPTRDQHSGDVRLRAMFQRHAEALDALLSADERVLDKAERLQCLADHLAQRDERGLTVLDRKREHTRGIPAVSYTPSSGRQPEVCPFCDDTTWLSSNTTKRCTACSSKRQRDRIDQATADLKHLERTADLLELALKITIGALEAGHDYPSSSDRRLDGYLRVFEDSFAASPPASRGGDLETERLLAKNDIRSAPDCPHCRTIEGFACPCRESTNGRGDKEVRAVCEFCERWAKRDPDPDNPGSPMPYLLVMHYREERARLLEPHHTQRREMEAWARQHRTKGAA